MEKNKAIDSEAKLAVLPVRKERLGCSDGRPKHILAKRIYPVDSRDNCSNSAGETSSKTKERRRSHNCTCLSACVQVGSTYVSHLQHAARHYFLLVTTQTAAAGGETTLVLRFIAGGQVVQVQFSLIGHIFRRERERETEDVLRVADGRTDARTGCTKKKRLKAWEGKEEEETE